MADYYTNFSIDLPLPDQAAQEYALRLAQDAASWRLDEQIPEDFPPSLGNVLEYWHFDTEALSSEGEFRLWLHSGDGGIDAVCEFIRHLLTKFNPTGRVEFEWSHDCSKPRTDAYGGGAAIITARQIKTMTTGEWLAKQNARRTRQLETNKAKGGKR